MASRFLDFLNTRDRVFRTLTLYLPLGASAGLFVLNWLIRGKGAAESLTDSALLFLIVCFIGLVEEAVRQSRLR